MINFDELVFAPATVRAKRDILRIIRKSLFASLALGSGAAATVSSQLHAGGDKVVFPEHYAQGVMYTTADDPISTTQWATEIEKTAQSRKHYATAGAIKALRNGEPMPTGSVITVVKYQAKRDAQGNIIKHDNGRLVRGELIGFSVMEKRTGWGSDYPSELRNGEWQFQEFQADRTPNRNVNLPRCFQCHKSQARKDFVFTLDKIKAVVAK